MTDLETAARRVLEMLDDHQIRVFMKQYDPTRNSAMRLRIADLRAALDQQPPTSCAACEVEFGKIGACTLNDAKRHLEVFRCRIAVGVRCVCGAHVSDVMEAEEKS